jgi:hypothetical protein
MTLAGQLSDPVTTDDDYTEGASGLLSSPQLTSGLVQMVENALGALGPLALHGAPSVDRVIQPDVFPILDE